MAQHRRRTLPRFFVPPTSCITFVGTILVCLLAVMLAAISWKKLDKPLNPAIDKLHSKSQVVETPCGLIEYGVDGPVDGTPIMISHGLFGGYDHGLHFGEGLAKRGYRVISPSRFGYLDTPAPDDDDEEETSLTSSANLFSCLMDALHKVQKKRKMTLVGFSAGALPSFKFAQLYPDRLDALVLVVPTCGESIQGHKPRSFWISNPRLKLMGLLGVFKCDSLYRLVRWLAPEVLVSTALGTPSHLYKNANEYEKNYIDIWIDLFLPLDARQQGMVIDMNLRKEKLDDVLEEIQTPTIAIAFEDDGYNLYESTETIAHRVQHGSFLGYPTGGHMGIGHLNDIYDGIDSFIVNARKPHHTYPLDEAISDLAME